MSWVKLVVDVNVLDAVLVYTVSGVAGILCSLGESDLKNPKLGERYSKMEGSVRNGGAAYFLENLTFL